MPASQLTSDQVAALQAFMTMLRPSAIQVDKIIHVAQLIEEQYALNIFTILSSLDAGAIIPDTTGLAGAIPLSAGDVMAATQDLQALVTAMTVTGMETRRLSLAGAVNLV